MPSGRRVRCVVADPDWDLEDEPAAPTASLVAILARAFRDYHGGQREPTTLAGQLQWIDQNTPQGRAGRPADAIGVSAAAWNNWVSRSRGFRDKSGKPLGSKPSPTNLARIRDLIAATRVTTRPAPTNATVRAVVVWAGYQNGIKTQVGGRPDFSKVRTVRLDGLDLSASQRSWTAREDWHSAQQFLSACSERYGQTIEFPGCRSITLEWYA